MSEFDPYLKWLGIRESTRPINHYRLLGLELFESDPDVISMAADRQMAHIRTYQNGPHGELSQQILNELSRARRTLLVADKKSQYDQQLQASLPTAPTAEAPPVAIPKSSAPAIDVAIESDHSSHRKARKKREQKQAAWSLVGWVLGGVAAVAVAAVLIGTGILPLGGNRDPEILAQNEDSDASDPAVAVPADNTNTSPVEDAPGSENAPPNQPDNQPGNDGDSNLTPEPTPAKTPNAQPRDASPTAKPTLPPSSKFTLGNIQQYPPRREQVKAMLNRLARSIADQQIVASELSNPETKQVELIDRPADAKLLNGVRVWFDDQLQLCGLRAYYLSPDTISVGDLIGKQTADYVDAIADPGYAVSSVTVTGNTALRAIQLHFLPLGANGFRVGGTGYSSAWLGNDEGLKVQLFPDRHQPIVGIYGSAGFQLNSIGLIRVGTVGRDLDLALTGRPANPLPTGGTSDAPEVDHRIEIPSPTERRTLATRLEAQYQLVLPSTNLSARARAQMIRSLADRARSRAMNESDPDRKYVLMELAGKHYALLGDAPTVVSMLKEIDRDYQIDFWVEIKKAMEALVPLVPANQALAYKQTLDELIRQAVSEHEFEVAHELVDGAQKLSGSFQQLKRWYQKRGDLIEEFESLVEGHEAAAAALQTDAADPEANEFMGDYRLLVEEDLATALNHWAKSDSSELQRIAEAELNRDDSDGQQLIELAEKWERMGRGKANLRKIAALERALEIYEQARVMVEEGDQERISRYISDLRQKLGL